MTAYIPTRIRRNKEEINPIPSPKSIGGAIWQIARFKAPRGATLGQICLHCGAQNGILRYEFYEFKIGEGIEPQRSKKETFKPS